MRNLSLSLQQNSWIFDKKLPIFYSKLFSWFFSILISKARNLYSLDFFFPRNAFTLCSKWKSNNIENCTGLKLLKKLTRSTRNLEDPLKLAVRFYRDSNVKVKRQNSRNSWQFCHLTLTFKVQQNGEKESSFSKF